MLARGRLYCARHIAHARAFSSQYGQGYFQELSRDLDDALETIDKRIKIKGIDEKEKKLQAELEKDTLWDDPQNASKLTKQHAALKKIIDDKNQFRERKENNLELALLALEEEEDDNDQVIDECAMDLQILEKQVNRLRLSMMLDGPADHMGCYIEVNAGAGGTESMEFTEMLLNMYKKWAEQSGYSATFTDLRPGDEAGLRRGTLQVDGENSYGWLKVEAGVHRLVRVSLHDTQGRRHTAFSQVGVYPNAGEDDDVGVEIKESDLKIDTFRASGAGGQHVNTTESAVRITHLPTGIIAASQQERSQHQNKRHALSVLKARILDQKLQQQREKRSEVLDSLGDTSWGNQIRNYVLNPYQLVKDNRTNHETNNTDMVFAGSPEYLTPFMEAMLMKSQSSDEE